MLLKSIKIHNIRSYLDERIDFPDGSVLLAGDIGSGKTTVLLAIEFALFGIMRGVLSGKSLLRNGKNNGYVELGLDINSQNIVIYRSLKRTKTDVVQDTGYLSVDGMQKSYTPVELKTKVLELLGYPLELVTKSKALIYRYTVYTPQEEMKQILMENKEYRIDTLRRLFQIHKYKTIRENCQILVQEIKGQMRTMEGQVQDIEDKKRMRAEKKSVLDSLHVEMGKSESQLLSIRQDVERQKLEMEKLDSDIKRLTEIRAQLTSLQNSLVREGDYLRNLQAEKLSLQNQIARMESDIKLIRIRVFERPLADVELELDKKQSELRGMEAERAKLNESISHLTRRMEEISAEIKDAEKRSCQLKENQNQLDEIKKEVARKPELQENLKSEEEHFTKTKLDIRELTLSMENSVKVVSGLENVSVCPLCRQNLTPEHKQDIIRKENQVQSGLRKRLAELNAVIECCDKNIRNLRPVLDSISLREKQMERISAELGFIQDAVQKIQERVKLTEALKKQIAELQSRRDSLPQTERISAEMSALSSLLREMRENEKTRVERENLAQRKHEKEDGLLRLQNELSFHEKELNSLHSSQKQLESEIQRFKNLEFSYKTTKERLDELREQEKMVMQEHSSQKARSEEFRSQIEFLSEEIRFKQEKQKQLNHLKEMAYWLSETFVSLTSVIEQQVMLKVRDEFESLFIQFFSMLMETEQIAVRLDEEFTPVIEQNGYEISIEDLSGGERTSVALAYRLAINRVVNDLIGDIKTTGLIILDEPTDGFSSEQLDKVRSVLDQLSIRQILLVSHESKIESFVRNVITIYKHEHVSRVMR